MSKRISLIVLMVLAFGLSWSGIQRAASQQEVERKQMMAIGYPNPAIIISGSGTRYGGIIYVKVTPVSPNLVQKYGSGPMMTVELSPSMRDVRPFPVGDYEVSFAMRTGSEMKTVIKRDVFVRPEAVTQLSVEMNSDAKTTIIGGDMSIQQIEDGLRHAEKDNADLKEEIVKLKQK